jgi:hypothetical protein
MPTLTTSLTSLIALLFMLLGADGPSPTAVRVPLELKHHATAAHMMVTEHGKSVR